MGIEYLKDALKTLESQSYYAIEVSLFTGNPPCNAILYTGFINSGGYQAIFVSGGQEPISPSEYPNTLIKIINKIGFPRYYVEWEDDWNSPRKFNKYGNLKGTGK